MVTAVTNGSISPEYKRKLNRLATVRDYLIDVATKLTIVNIDSAKLQASTLAQLTAATNELTRSGSVIEPSFFSPLISILLSIDACSKKMQ